MIKILLFKARPYLRTLVGIVFLCAASLKYSMITTTESGPKGGIDAFAATIARGEVFPHDLTFPIAAVVFGLEILIGLALLTHLAPKFWTGIATLLLLALTIYLVFLQVRGQAPSCGCLGQWDTSIPIGIGRNALLSLACLPTLLTSRLTVRPTASPRNTAPATHR